MIVCAAGGLSAAADSYLTDHTRLHGILVLSRNFPFADEVKALDWLKAE